MIVGLVLLPLAMPQIGARTSMLRRARPRVAPLKAEVLAPLKSEHESAGVCTIVEASPPQSCSYSLIENACMPMKSCRVGTCGLITCECRRLASHAQAPWDVLRLNFSSALDAKAVLTAFDKRARLLAPAKNPACLARACCPSSPLFDRGRSPSLLALALCLAVLPGERRRAASHARPPDAPQLLHPKDRGRRARARPGPPQRLQEALTPAARSPPSRSPRRSRSPGPSCGARRRAS